MSSSTDFDFPDFGGMDPGRAIEPDGRPPSFMSGSARGSGRFDAGAASAALGAGDGSGRDGETSLAGGGFFCVAGALLDGTGATASSASALPHDVHDPVPSAAYVSQRPQTMPISGSKGRGELTKSQ